MNQKTILKAENINKIFGSGHTQVKAVKNVSLSLESGELVLIMGPSGSGKTTLLSMLGGLLKPTDGSIEINGTNISEMSESQLPTVRAHKIGFIFQAFNLLDALTVEENILFPSQLTSEPKAEVKKRSHQLIERLGLSNRKDALPATLSGGEKQRVAIARALINKPPIILADEPTGNLDSQSGQDVLMVLHDIARDEGCSVLLVTHDPRVEDLADRILWLEDGQLSDRVPDKKHWVHCPVCKMRVDKWTAKFLINHNDQTYIFCSENCLSRFKSEPSKFTRPPENQF